MVAQINALMALPRDLERQYWAWDNTAARLLAQDKLGAPCTLGIHLLLMIYIDDGHGWGNVVWVPWYCRFCVLYTAAQLAWLHCRPDSYLAWRSWVIVAHRLRWLGLMVGVTYCAATPDLLNLERHLHKAGFHGSVKTLLGLIFAFVIGGTFPITNFLAPARLQAVLGLPHQMTAIDAWGLRPLLPRACSVMRSLFDPAALGFGPGSGPAQCSPGQLSMVFMFPYAAAVGVLPVLLISTSEYNSKLAFLRHRGLLDAGAETLRHRPALLSAMQCWAACAMCWSLLSVCYLALEGW